MPPKTADKGKKVAKKKGKLDINIKSWEEEELIAVNTNPTDTVLDLRNAIVEIMQERQQDKDRAEQGASYQEPNEPSEEELQEQALLLALQYDGAFMENLDITLGELGFSKDTVVDLIKPAKQTGEGSFQFPNGSVYTGEWKLFNRLKARHGRGSLVFGKEKYDGDWVKDVIEGRGSFTFASGAVYEGSFVAAKFHGMGKNTWPNGSQYEGQWENNTMHGVGCFTLSNGDKFEGRFERDLFLNDQGHWIPVPAQYPFLA